jgi:hypothetical protein
MNPKFGGGMTQEDPFGHPEFCAQDHGNMTVGTLGAGLDDSRNPSGPGKDHRIPREHLIPQGLIFGDIH